MSPHISPNGDQIPYGRWPPIDQLELDHRQLMLWTEILIKRLKGGYGDYTTDQVRWDRRIIELFTDAAIVAVRKI